MASAANTGNPSDSEDDLLTGFLDDDFGDQEEIMMRTGDDLLSTSPLLLQMKSQGQQAAGATDPEANQSQARAATALRRLEPHNQPGNKEQALPSSRLRGQGSRLKEQAPWSPDFPFCAKPECAGCRSTCRKLGAIACQLCDQDLEPLCERRKPCQFEYQDQYPVLLEVRDKMIHNFTVGRMPPPQQKSPQRTTSTPEEQQVTSARKEVELEEEDLEDLQGSKEAQVTEQQMRTQMEEETHTFPQNTPAIPHQQEDLEQEDVPVQEDPIGFGWAGKFNYHGPRSIMTKDVEENEEEEKLQPQERQRVTFYEEDRETDLYEGEPLSAAAAAIVQDIVRNPLHTAPATNTNRIFGAHVISPPTFEGLAQQPPASTWRGYLPGLPETTTMPQVQNEIWNDLRRPAALQDSVFHTPVGETVDRSQAYSTIRGASAQSRMMNEDMSPAQMQALEMIRRGSSIPPHQFDTVLEAAQRGGPPSQERRAQYNFHDRMREAEKNLQLRQREGEAMGAITRQPQSTPKVTPSRPVQPPSGGL